MEKQIAAAQTRLATTAKLVDDKLKTASGYIIDYKMTTLLYLLIVRVRNLKDGVIFDIIDQIGNVQKIYFKYI